MSKAAISAADTISSFHNTVRANHFEEAGFKWFLYDGPIDDRTRVWCRRFAGTRVTREILNKHEGRIERNHPLPPSVSLGGYNCRHELIPLVDEKDIKRYPIGPRRGVYVSPKI